MSRYLKAAGLALAVAFAIGAVAASSASAVTHTFDANGSRAFLTAEAENNQVLQVTPGDAKSIVCKKINVTGTQEGTEVSAGTFSRADVTVSPSYSECGLFEGEKELVSLRINTHGCKFKFTGETTETVGGTPGEHATAHIEGCSNATEGITVEISALNSPCIHISEQTVHGIRYNNRTTESGVKDVTIEATISGIQSDTTNFALVCPTPSGGTETHNNGTYTGKSIIKGFKDEAHKEATNLSTNPGFTLVTHTFHADGPQAFLTAENDPGSKQVLKAAVEDKKEIICKKVTVAGTLEGTKIGESDYSKANVTGHPEYSECSVFEGGKELASAKINTSTCKYKFTGETTQSEGITGEHATLHIEGCANATEGITVEATALNRPCMHISEQTVHGIRYNNLTTEGGVKDVTIETTISGIQSDTTSFALVCPTPSGETETDNNGTYNGKVIVKGFNEQILKELKIEHKTPTSIFVNPG